MVRQRRATTTERLLTIDDQIASRYLPIPVEVPEGAGALQVSLDVDAGDEDSVLDLGCEGAAGWRGWSGGARREFTIGADDATPGYLPGELEAGTWHVVLGLHRIGPDGVRVRVHTRILDRAQVPNEALAPERGRERRASDRAVPAEAGLTWYAGDFHAHTNHSDGSQSLDQLAARGAEAGLDFLAITDHNTIAHHRLLPGTGARHHITLLPGQEVTTADGHANALGPMQWVDFRKPVQHWADHVAAAGGVLSINHAIDADCAWLFDVPQGLAAMEVWHISWFRDLTATGPWAAWRALGPDLIALGGSDFHCPRSGWNLGTPTTWVAAEDDSPEAILAGVAAGRTAISLGVRPDATPDPLHSPLLVRTGGELHALEADGGVLIDGEGRRRRIHGAAERISADAASGPYRVVAADGRLLAISA